MQPPAVSPTQDQGNAFADVFKVLYEPTAVFERVRERTAILAPYLVICAVQIALFFFNMPFMKAGMAAQLAARPAGGPDPSKFLFLGAIFIPVGFAIALVIGGGILWVLVSVLGGDGKFTKLMSVVCYAAVPSVLVLAIVGTAVLHLQGIGQVTSMQDLQPALGLDLLAPGTKGFMGAVLRGINPFSIWGLVLTAIGVSTTHRLSKTTGYTVATVSFLLGVLIAAAFAGIGSRAG